MVDTPVFQSWKSPERIATAPMTVTGKVIHKELKARAAAKKTP